MAAADIGQRWPGLSEAVSTGIREWRLQNPKATFSEIERELDLRLAKLRGRMLQDTALAVSATDWSGNQPGAKPACPDCGAEPVSWGKRRRRLPTLGGPEVTLECRYGVCPACGGKFRACPWSICGKNCLPRLRREVSPRMQNRSCCRAA